MAPALQAIPLANLAIAFVPAIIVLAIMYRWRAGAGTALYASARMLVQLLLIGYVLVYIFETDNWLVIAGVLMVMLSASSWIAVRTLEPRDTRPWLQALAAISLGGVPVLALVTQGVIGADPWFSPRHVVPLAGMIFAGSMNAVSLAAERYQAECARDVRYVAARRIAIQAALIPMINSLFAVGLVALPGMMTGQILSGVSPLVAAQYQIVVMTMLFGSEGISAACWLRLQKTKDTQ